MLIAVNNRISCTQVTSPDGLEAISIQLNLSNLITVWVMYIPPSSTAASDCNNLFDFLRDSQDVHDNLILMGDFIFQTSIGTHYQITATLQINSMI